MWPFGKKKKTLKELDKTRSEYEKKIEQHQKLVAKQTEAAQALGRHYVDWVEPVKTLKRQGKINEAERILNACIEAAERESKLTSYGVPPWYYEQLAIIYRKQDRLGEEVAILERFMRQKHGRGAKLDGMADRLVKARALWAKQKGTVR